MVQDLYSPVARKHAVLTSGILQEMHAVEVQEYCRKCELIYKPHHVEGTKNAHKMYSLS